MEYKECSNFTEREQNKYPDWIIITIKDKHICRGKNKKRWVIDKGFGPSHINTRMTPNKTECILFSCFCQKTSFWYTEYVLYWKGERMSPQQYQIATLNSMLLFLLFRKWQHFTHHPVPVSNTVTYVENEKFPLHGIRCAFHGPLWPSRCC